MLLRMEDTRSVSSWLGGQEFLLGHILTIEQVIEKIDAIEDRDIMRVASQLFVNNVLNLAIVGPVEEQGLSGLLHL